MHLLIAISITVSAAAGRTRWKEGHVLEGLPVELATFARKPRFWAMRLSCAFANATVLRIAYGLGYGSFRGLEVFPARILLTGCAVGSTPAAPRKHRVGLCCVLLSFVLHGELFLDAFCWPRSRKRIRTFRKSRARSGS